MELLASGTARPIKIYIVFIHQKLMMNMEKWRFCSSRPKCPFYFRTNSSKKSQIYLDMDGHQHEIMIENRSDATLNLISPRKDKITLSKGFPQRDGKKNSRAKIVE